MVYECEVYGFKVEICGEVCERGLNCNSSCRFSYTDAEMEEKLKAFEIAMHTEYGTQKTYLHEFEIKFRKQVKKGKPIFIDTCTGKSVSFSEQPEKTDFNQAKFEIEQKANKKEWLKFEILEVNFKRTI